MIRKTLIGNWALAMLVTLAAADVIAEESAGGQVKLPLETYKQLLQSASDPTLPPRPVPASHALGTARITVSVTGSETRATGSVQVQLDIEVLEDEWVLIPVLPAGTAVESVTVDGKPVQLIASPHGLAWSTNHSGSYRMSLGYRVDANRVEGGYTLPLPVPAAAAIQLTATLPGTGLDATVIPAAGTRISPAGNTTQLTASVPTTRGVQISWRTPSKLGHSISRARYSGRLTGEAVSWTGELIVELLNEETAVLPLFPRGTTLSELQVDGKEATILIENDRFATLVRGRGRHTVAVGFQVPVSRGSGPPRVDLQIPPIPVSQFELTLPGKAEVTVSPTANVTSRTVEENTLASVHVPMTERVSFTWSEAVPEEIRAEVRANSTIYHAVHAEEGVLYVHALMVYEVSRGETNRIELTLPAEAQIDRIDSPSGAVADWRVGEAGGDGRRPVSVYLDRQLQGPLRIDVHYDRALEPLPQRQPIDVPLVRPVGAQRQRGMVALLSNSEQTLNPVGETEAIKIGENQLPALVRETIEMTVAHTYKYAQALPRLVVEAAVPERVQGKFDAQVDTLVSLGDVTLTGTASIQLNVKSGSILALQLELPADVNLLNLTAPSLREHRVSAAGDRQLVDIEFTQEMEGQFRLELAYERILLDREAEVGVPRVEVRGAEVEQGRIGVEALAAVEVQPAVTEQLSTLDVGELPRQLVLRTANPILLAFKYVHTDPEPRLALRVTRHPLVGVQEAAIDRADYRTLFTVDGLVVTTARFTVRNSSKQFLRVLLPEGSQVWSAFVDGSPEQPALAAASDDEKAEQVLIKIINSTEGFPVELIYATPGRGIGRLGSVRGSLPRPDILVTQSSWNVYLPEGPGYAEPSTNMTVVERGVAVTRQQIDAEFAVLARAAADAGARKPLRIVVPTAGVHYAFEKLYANQPEQAAWFKVAYISAGGRWFGRAVGLLGLSLLWLGIALALGGIRTAPLPARGVAVAGLVLLIVAIRFYRFGMLVPLVLSLLIALGLGLYHGRKRVEGWRQARQT